MDYSIETPIYTKAHYRLSYKTQPYIPFVDTYYFGTSTRNVRIESWWGEIQKSCLYRWRVSSIFL